MKVFASKVAVALALSLAFANVTPVLSTSAFAQATATKELEQILVNTAAKNALIEQIAAASGLKGAEQSALRNAIANITTASALTRFINAGKAGSVNVSALRGMVPGIYAQFVQNAVGSKGEVAGGAVKGGAGKADVGSNALALLNGGTEKAAAPKATRTPAKPNTANNANYAQAYVNEMTSSIAKVREIVASKGTESQKTIMAEIDRLLPQHIENVQALAGRADVRLPKGLVGCAGMFLNLNTKQLDLDGLRNYIKVFGEGVNAKLDGRSAYAAEVEAMIKQVGHDAKSASSAVDMLSLKKELGGKCEMLFGKSV